MNVQAQEVIWAKECRMPNIAGYNNVIGSVMDHSGNSYVAGYFYLSASFDTITLTSSGGSSIYVAKYNPEGKLISVFQNTGTGQAQLIAFCIDNNDNLILLGDFEGNINLGGSTTSGDIGIMSYFIVKMNTSGSVSWVKTLNNSFSGLGYDIRANSITCDKTDNLYLYGYVDDTYTLDGIPLLNANGFVYLAKLNPATGAAIWARQIKALSIDGSGIYPVSILTDYNNNVIVSGNFSNPSLGFNGTDTVHFNPSATLNAYMAKYDQYGNFNWAKNLDSLMTVTNAAIDSNNNIYVIGRDYSWTSIKSNYGKYRPTGNRVWFNHLESFASTICNYKNANFLTSEFTDSFCYMGYSFVAPGGKLVFKTDTNSGALLWHSQPFTIDPASIFANGKGVIQISGNCSPMSYIGDFLFPYSGGSVALLHDTDFSPPAHNIIRGNVFNDTDNNCIRTLDPIINGVGIIALPGPYYAVSDSQGNYALMVDTGSYLIKELTSHAHSFMDSVHCPTGVYTVSMTSAGLVDTGYDFQNKYTACSFLDIDSLYDSHLSSCNTIATRSFKICNHGLDTARNPVLTIKYPDSIFSPLSCSVSSYAYNSSTYTMTVALSDILPNNCLSISILDTVACSTAPYTSYSFTLHVTPINECFLADTVFNNDTVMSYFVGTGLSVRNNTRNSIELSAYPNPTLGEISVSGLGQATSLEVYNIFGSKLFSKKEPISEMEKIDLTKAPSGIYIISAVGAQRVMFKRISKL
jgi:hypothetical protein